jgi:hypothetical protein
LNTIKRTLLLSFILCYHIAAFAQQRINDQLYQFNKQYLHLGQLEYKNIDGILLDDFKQVGIYSNRFSRLSSNLLDYKGSLFYIGVKNSLAVKFPNKKDKKILPNLEKDTPNRGANYLLQSTTGILHIKDLDQKAGYQIYKYDETGKLLFETKIKHSRLIEKSSYQYYLPYLKYKLHTPDYIFFTSYEQPISKTIRLDVQTGKKKLFDFTLAGVILEESKDSDVVGYLRFDANERQLLIDYLDKNFIVKLASKTTINTVETLLHQDTLLLVCYNDKAPLTTLLAFDLKTQQVVWEKQIQPKRQVKTPFYFNKVWLSRFEQKIILESYESAGRQLHIFDWDNGDILWKG